MSAFAKVKEREAAERMRMLRRAAKGRRAAALEQRRASLVGRRKSRITNMDQVLAAMAKWA
jgi:hypothetical protein